MAKQKKRAQSPQPPPPRNDTPPVSLTSPPADNQNVQHNNKIYTTVREGAAYILIPPDAPRLLDPKTHKDEPAQSVFYNPIQQYNRDLTVLAIRAFGEDYLKRQEGRKARKKKKPTSKSAGETENGSEKVRVAGESAPKKRKRDGDVQAADVKRQRVRTGRDVAEFDEDGGVDDEDLLAVESSMQENAPFSTAREPSSAANGESTATETVPHEDASTLAQKPQQEQDTRPQFRILDALSATGLRALRYAQELPFNTHITANDLSKNAVEAIKLNIKHNRLESKIKTSVGNANAHMYSYVAQEGNGGPAGKYHVIDLDPYGTAVPFLDAAVQATADNGLLCVTCTDTGVFNSMGYAEKAFALYGGVPGRGEHCHEVGLRLILHAIATAAAKHGVAIEPLLSLSIDYYARVFVRVKKSPADVKFLASKTMLVYACDHGCGAWYPQFVMRAQEQSGRQGSVYHKHIVSQGPSCEKLCECCGGKMHIAGPMWGGALHNPGFVSSVLRLVREIDTEVYGTLNRVEGMLSVAMEEMMIHDTKKMLMPEPTESKAQQTEKSNGVAMDAKANGHTAKEDEATAGAARTPTDLDRSRRNSSSPPTSPLKPATDPAEPPAEAKPTEAPIPPTTPTYQPLQPAFRDVHPFYFIPSSLSRILHVQSPPDAAIRGALRGLGYQTVRSHAQPGTIKTDAPWSTIWDIMVAWSRKVGIREGALKEGSAGLEVLRRVEKREKERVGREDDEGRKIVFDEKLGKEEGVGRRLVRYQINPRANWGPMARAK